MLHKEKEQSADTGLENLIRRMLGKLPSGDREERARIYQFAYRQMKTRTKTLSGDQKAVLEERLKDVVERLEREFLVREKSEFDVEQESSPVSAHKKSGSPITAWFHDIFSNRFVKFGTWHIQKRQVILSACLAFFGMGLFILYSQYQTGNLNVGSERSVDGEGANTATNGLPLSFASAFSEGLDQFDISPASNEGEVKVDRSSGTLTVRGQATLFAKEFMPVSRGNTYFMRVVFRPVAREGQGGNIGFYSGFATYNGDKRLETSVPSHRYFVIDGVIPTGITPDQDGWYSLGGIITGSGASREKFRPTSAFAKPVLIVNFNMPDAVLEIREIEVMELG